MKRNFYFDMDGTIADLYAVNGWLDMLIAEDTTPYAEACPMCHMSSLARKLNTIQRNGGKLIIISWTSKGGSDEYNAEVAEVKLAWLKRHLRSVQWDAIHIVPYGTPKQMFCEHEYDILFDDEARNRDNWTGLAYDPADMLDVLRVFVTL